VARPYGRGRRERRAIYGVVSGLWLLLSLVAAQAMPRRLAPDSGRPQARIHLQS
jgi:hypothetical protein